MAPSTTPRCCCRWRRRASIGAAGSPTPVACDTAPMLVRTNGRGKAARVADPERRRATENLKTHYVRGLINVEELEGRVEGVYRAKTRGEIAVHLRDLP